MSAQREPEFNDPVELLDELDAVIREQELLVRRTQVLRARYGALQSAAEAGRFDKPGEVDWFPEEFGRVNVESTVDGLEYLATSMQETRRWSELARERAARVREYPQPQREQSSAPSDCREAGRDRAVDRRRSR